MPIGILKYADVDDSIILKSTLLSEASIVTPEVGSATGSVGLNQTFTGTGMRIDTGGGGAKFVDLVGAGPLDYAGQMSIDILSSYLCYEDTLQLAGSEGLTLPVSPSASYYIEWDDGGSNFGRLARELTATGQVIQWYAKSGETYGAACLNTINKELFTRLTISWVGSQMVLYVDGKPLERAINGTEFRNSTRAAYYSNLFKDIYIGAYRASNTGPSVDCIFRNLLISTQPVMLPRIHGFGNLVFWGPSFVESYSGYDDVGINSVTEGATSLEIEKIYAEKGLGVKPISTVGLGGAAISDETGNSMSTTIAKNGSTNLLDYTPDYIVTFGCGVNDVINYASIDISAFPFEDELKLRLDEIFTSAGGENIKGMVLCNIPTVKYNSVFDTPLFVDAKQRYNASINLMPAYAVAQGYPIIVIADLNAVLGNENSPYGTFLGQLPGHNNLNLHLSMLGNSVAAELIVDKLEELI